MLLSLPCRYYRVFTDADVSCDEQNFHHVEKTLPLPVEQTALVLVDLWNTHYIDSWRRRATEVTQTRIVPLLTAARRIGMTVIHGPSPQVAVRYTRPPSISNQQSAISNQQSRDWPPSAFRSIYRSGEYAAFGRHQEPRLQEALEQYKTELDIAEPVRPIDGEPVIHTGAEMHGLLAERRILHLIYAGFATNWCIMYRDYGMLAMCNLGYNLVLVRDATTGVEFHDSVEALTATQIMVREIETKHGWSTTTDAFIEACSSR